MLRCFFFFFFKSLSLAIIYSILGVFAEHACSCADLKLSVLPEDISAIAADGGESKLATFALTYSFLLAWKNLKYLDVFVVFPVH